LGSHLRAPDAEDSEIGLGLDRCIIDFDCLFTHKDWATVLALIRSATNCLPWRNIPAAVTIVIEIAAVRISRHCGGEKQPKTKGHLYDYLNEFHAAGVLRKRTYNATAGGQSILKGPN
jgi:hypothetical protein